MSNIYGWRTGGVVVGGVYRLGVEDLSRLGHVAMRGRMKVGDVVVATKHSGDCFWDYVLVSFSQGANGGVWLRVEKVGAISGYALGRKVSVLNESDLTDLLDGCLVPAATLWTKFEALEDMLDREEQERADRLAADEAAREATLQDSWWAS